MNSRPGAGGTPAPAQRLHEDPRPTVDRARAVAGERGLVRGRRIADVRLEVVRRVVLGLLAHHPVARHLRHARRRRDRQARRVALDHGGDRSPASAGSRGCRRARCGRARSPARRAAASARIAGGAQRRGHARARRTPRATRDRRRRRRAHRRTARAAFSRSAPGELLRVADAAQVLGRRHDRGHGDRTGPRAATRPRRSRTTTSSPASQNFRSSRSVGPILRDGVASRRRVTVTAPNLPAAMPGATTSAQQTASGDGDMTDNWGRWGADDERGTLNLRHARGGAGRDPGRAAPARCTASRCPIQREGVPIFDYRGAPQRLSLGSSTDTDRYAAFGAPPGVGANEDMLVLASHSITHMDALVARVLRGQDVQRLRRRGVHHRDAARATSTSRRPPASPVAACCSTSPATRASTGSSPAR